MTGEGPGSTAKYEHELAAFDDLGLDDAGWWAAAGPLLARVLDGLAVLLDRRG